MDILVRQWIVFHIMVTTYTEINFSIEFIRTGIFIAIVSAGIYWLFWFLVFSIFLFSLFCKNRVVLIVIQNLILLRNYLPLIDIENREEFENHVQISYIIGLQVAYIFMNQIINNFTLDQRISIPQTFITSIVICLTLAKVGGTHGDDYF